MATVLKLTADRCGRCDPEVQIDHPLRACNCPFRRQNDVHMYVSQFDIRANQAKVRVLNGLLISIFQFIFLSHFNHFQRNKMRMYIQDWLHMCANLRRYII